MRWGVIILLGVFFVSFASAVVSDDTCDSSMIAYWQFENNLLDSSGTYGGYEDHSGGSWSGTARYGDLSNGAVFEGVEKITIPDAADLDFYSAFTIEFWLDADGLVGDLFKKGSHKIEWVDGGFLQPKYIRATVGTSIITSGNIDDTDHHIALVWDSSGSMLRLYIDGVNVNETALSSAANAAGDLIIGDGFTGLIDELAIYDSVLSDSTIGLHYALGGAGKDYCDESGAEGSSSTKTVFNIRGCNFDIGGGDTFGVAKGTCSGLPHDGLYFCSEYQEAFVTKDEGLGCAMGDSLYETDSGADFCCPPGWLCNDTLVQEGTGSFKCDRRTKTCAEIIEKDPCLDNGCIWLDIEGICVDGMRDYNCGYYQDESACKADEWNLGTTSVGTEICGTTFECDGQTFSVPEEDCVCEWYEDSNIDQKCLNKFVAKSMFSGEDGDQNIFEWTNAYELEECIDGEQDVIWSSNVEVIAGPILELSGVEFAAAYDKCCDEVGCNGGSGTRFCGEPIIKLPGFSLFAFFASLFFVGIYYIKKEPPRAYLLKKAKFK